MKTNPTLNRRQFLELMGAGTAASFIGVTPTPASPYTCTIKPVVKHYRLKSVAMPEPLAMPSVLRAHMRKARRIVDLAGTKLNLGALTAFAYELRRQRECHAEKGQRCDTIDLLLPVPIRAEFMAEMKAHFAERYGVTEDQLTRYVTTPPMNEITPCFVCDLPDAGLNLAAFEFDPVDPNDIWLPDWSEIYFSGHVGHPGNHLIFENAGGFSRV